ncbi:phosphoenolpyruvate phosphomutase-domain-containing protein [Aspergillus pseudoustus]|uniref:Phosphoenolpyruvate phosphomutase-domain-containing protein n=1 Tax=Aspergillus pseudoustus TaxID=1810923 RepID=A0ABR4KL00_9EURO
MAVNTPQNELAKRFRSLHVPGEPIVLTNVYDAATASFIASHPATKAIASASFAIAASQGIPDNDLTLSQNLATVRLIAGALTVDSLPRLPLSVDVQDGYEPVAETIKEVISLGAVGCNIEDFNNRTEQMRTLPDAVGRIELAIQTARELGVPDFVVNARTDILGHGGTVEDAIERGKAFLKAGACSVFVWGPDGRGVSTEEVEKLVAALDGRVNVKLVIKQGYLTIPELKRIGVARVSMGPELYRAAMRAFEETATRLLES